jgi:hypothetical protein
MKKAIAILFMGFSLALCGCQTPNQTPPLASAQPAQASSSIDWTKVSGFYHDYVAGMIAPVGLTVATIADPAAGPAIAIASKEVANLDSLLAAKASNADIQAQAKILGQAVTDANAKVGAMLASATAPPATSTK